MAAPLLVSLETSKGLYTEWGVFAVKYPAPVQLIRFPIEMEKASEEEKRKVPCYI